MKAPAHFSRALIAFSVGALWAAGAAADIVAVPGTKVSLEPPPDFVLSSQFAGFQNAELASSILITELPAPLEQAAAGFTAEGLLSRGMTLQSSEETTVSGSKGRLFSVTQSANGTTFEKWMAAFGDSSSTVLVVATFPQSVASKLRDPMRAAVLSAVWKPDAEVDPFEGLSFRLRESENFKIQNRIQNMLLLGPPDFKPGVKAQPIAVVGASLSPTRIDDLELFARQRLIQTADIKDLGEIHGESVEIAGRPAYEITVEAKDSETGEGLLVYQLLLAKGDTYYLMQGMFETVVADEYLLELKALARTLEIP